MFGFGFALMPFYKKICEVTGVNNVLKADVVVNTQVDAARSVTIEFDSNLSGKLPWTFRPLQASVRVHPGELTTVMYEIRNTSDRAVTGQAIPSYGPQLAVRYFKKLECFCFTQQTLQPGEARQMPVVFVDRAGAAGRRQHDHLVVFVFRNRRHGQESRLMEMAEAQKPASATPLQVVKAVFWSFLGIRRRAEYEKDAVALKPAAGHRRRHHRRDSVGIESRHAGALHHPLTHGILQSKVTRETAS